MPRREALAKYREFFRVIGDFTKGWANQRELCVDASGYMRREAFHDTFHVLQSVPA